MKLPETQNISMDLGIMSQLECRAAIITKATIPAFLQDSAFYRVLSDDSDEEISVPTDCFKLDDTVANVAEFKRLLTTIRFWGARCIPDSIVQFPQTELKSVDDDFERDKTVAEFARDLTYLPILKAFRGKDIRQQVEMAIKVGEIELVKYFFQKGWTWLPADAKSAAQFGRLECLVFIHETGGSMGLIARYEAAANGHLECLKYLLSFNHELTEYEREHGLSFVLEQCASNGQLECLAYAHRHGCAWTKDVCKLAAKYNQLPCLQYAVEHGCPVTSRLCDRAACNNALDCLKYLHSIGTEWSTTTCEEAAMNGHLRCLQYLHEQGCPWDEETCRLAAQEGFSRLLAVRARAWLSLGCTDCDIFEQSWSR